MRWFFVSILCSVCFSTFSFAAVPQTISYQGYLTNYNGVPVSMNVAMTFSIYTVAENGTSTWTETQPVVAVNNGIYAVALGAINPIDPTIIDGDLWLGVKVGSDAEMTPRQKLSSVPFAMKASSVSDPVLEAIKKRARHDYSYLIDNADETISDPITGLMWAKTAMTGYTFLQASGTYDPTYNPTSQSVCGDSELAGYNDWRLPHLNELIDIFQRTFDTTDPVFEFVIPSPSVLWPGISWGGIYSSAPTPNDGDPVGLSLMFSGNLIIGYSADQISWSPDMYEGLYTFCVR